MALDSDRRRIALRALAIGVSVAPFGLSFGAVAISGGFSVLQICVLSLVLFSGASQFALVSIAGGGGGLASAVSTALLLGLRNGLYGARVNALLRPRRWRRLLTAQVTIDESTAMAVSENDAELSRWAFWVTAASVYVFWNIATLAGALVGRGLGSPATIGLDAAGPAAFAALLRPRLTHPRQLAVALTAAALAIATSSFLPIGLPVIVGGLAALAVLLVRR